MNRKVAYSSSAVTLEYVFFIVKLAIRKESLKMSQWRETIKVDRRYSMYRYMNKIEYKIIFVVVYQTCIGLTLKCKKLDLLYIAKFFLMENKKIMFWLLHMYHSSKCLCENGKKNCKIEKLTNEFHWKRNRFYWNRKFILF